jgi:hypothetical protein
MSDEQARLKILELIDSGKISANDGLKLLQALAKREEEPAAGDSVEDIPSRINLSLTVDAQGAVDQELAADTATLPSESGVTPIDTEDRATNTEQTPPSEEPGSIPPIRETVPPQVGKPASPPDFEKWRRFWMIPLWIGVGITVLSGMWMYWAFMKSGIGFWFICSWIPFFLGVALMAASYASRRSRWLHLRIDQKPGEKPQHIAISFPLPIRLASWFFRTFGHHIQGLPPEIKIDELLNAVDENTNAETPLYVEVDDDDGEKVRIYIG